MADIIAMFSRWATSGLSQMFSRVSSSYASTSSSMEPIRCTAVNDFHRIMRMLPRIEAVLEDAEEREVLDRSVNLWLSELRDLAYDIDDVVDEYEYEVLRVQIETRAAEEAYRYGKQKRSYDDHNDYDDGDGGREGHNILASSSSQLPAISDGIAQKLKEIRERFDEIESDRKALRLREEHGVRIFIAPQSIRLTSSLVDESSIFGREGDKEKIMEQLLLNSESINNFEGKNNITVIPIVGMGGVGKTTLAQLIYNDPKISDYFDHRAWIYVSEDFDLMGLTREIYRSIFKYPCLEHASFDHLQDSIKEQLKKHKRTFLVLDDVWNEKQSVWESLQLPFHGVGFVNILLTTRSKKVADIMGTTTPFYLDILSKEAGWRMFQQLTICDDDSLMRIGSKMVEKCGQLPLAIRILGSHLRFERDEDKWMNILESELWDLDAGKNEILPALKLSYQRMASHLKPCIRYCSMFPKNRIPHKSRLVWLWMAQGYIQPKAANKTMEEIGGQYFDELLDRSLLQPTESKYFFKMHDLIFDLIVFISGKEFITMKLEDGKQNKVISNNVRHLVVNDHMKHDEAQQDNLGYPFLSRHLALRSIFYYGQNIFNDFQLSNSKCLRTLHLNFKEYDPTMLMLLGSIASLKHIRYLYIGMDFVDYQLLNSDALSSIFNSFRRLYQLQVLDLSDCKEYLKLQASISDLINLQHVILPNYSSMPCGISKLTSLQTLKHVLVEEGSNECGGISELEGLESLTGNCCISLLCIATNVESVKKANINKKQHIRRLCLYWEEDWNCDDSFDVDIGFNYDFREEKRQSRELAEAILEALRPHHRLKGFELYKYPGSRFPLWLGDPSYSKLQDLKIYGCKEWDGSCGVLDRGLPCLQKISIIDCAKLKQLKIVQSSSLRDFLVKDCPKLSTLHGLCNLLILEKLEIRKCYNLMISVEDQRLPSKLHSVCFKDCWKLTSITGLHHLRSLKELKLRRCPKLQLSLDEQLLTTTAVVKVTDCPELMEWCQRYGYEFIQKVFKIEELTIRHNNDFKFYRESGAVSLKALHICNYFGRGFIKDEWIPCSLNTLFLKSCSLLRLLPPYQNLSSLRQLKLWNCDCLKYLQGLQMMESLEKLEIINCHELMLSLVQRLPSKLQYLWISDCSRLMWLPGLQQLTCLRDLKLYDCRELMLLPLEQLPFMHQVRLEIMNCPKLREWCRRYNLSYNNKDSPKVLFARSNQQINSWIEEASLHYENLCVLDYDKASLETEKWPACRILSFYVCFCVHLKSITFGDNFTRIKQLRIWNCCHLEELYGLYSLASLQELDISNCLNLRGLCPRKNLQSFQKIFSKASTGSEKMWLCSSDAVQILSGQESAWPSSSASTCFLKISKCPKLYFHDKFPLITMGFGKVEIHACPQLQEWSQEHNVAYFQD